MDLQHILVAVVPAVVGVGGNVEGKVEVDRDLLEERYIGSSREGFEQLLLDARELDLDVDLDLEVSLSRSTRFFFFGRVVLVGTYSSSEPDS